MLRGGLVRFAFIAGVLALLVGSVPAATLAQDATTFSTPDELRLQALSPDGTLIATTDNGTRTLCVHSVPGAEEIGCVELRSQSDITLDPASIAWSPDSDAFVFAERSAQFLIDSDIWHVDVATFTLTNLTDDGVSGGLPLVTVEDSAEEFQIDLAPAWSPDGATIAFSRFTFGQDDPAPTYVMVIDVASGDVRELAVFAEEQIWALPHHLAWSPSGNVLFTTGSSPDSDDEINGVWAIDAESGDSTRLAGANRDFLGTTAALTSVSPAGDYLVLCYPALLRGARAVDTPSGYALLDLVSGEITRIEPTDDYAGDYSVVVGPNFSPDGSTLIFGVRQPSEEAGFVIARNIESGDETVLAELPANVFPIAIDPMVPVQIGGGITLVLTDPVTGVVVELPEDLLDAPIPAATPGANGPEVAATPDTDGDEGESAQTTDAEVATLTVTIAENAAVLREGPSGDDDIIVILQPGTELTPLGEAFESDGHFWLEVKVIETGETGFVRTDFLEPVG